MVRIARTHMTGREVSRRFSKLLGYTGWQPDGLEQGFDVGSGCAIQPPTDVPGRCKIPRRLAKHFAAMEAKRICGRFVKAHFARLRMTPDQPQILEYVKGFYHGLYLGLRHAAQKVDRKPDGTAVTYQIREVQRHASA